MMKITGVCQDRSRHNCREYCLQVSICWGERELNVYTTPFNREW